ncbi:flavodoxin domain-containing protein [Thermoproteota archaeon]
MKHAIVLYWSNTGNTKKVAFGIKDGLEAAGVNVSLMKTT